MSEKTVPVTGGCQCGAVRYESNEPPNWVAYCHCRMCQKAYGNLFSIVAAFPAEALKFTHGEPKPYRSSEFTQRGFCSECGTPVSFVYDDEPEFGVLLGTLDHPEEWPPTANHGHMGIESKIPWYEILDGLPQMTTSEAFAYLPPEIRASAAADLKDKEDK